MAIGCVSQPDLWELLVTQDQGLSLMSKTCLCAEPARATRFSQVGSPCIHSRRWVRTLPLPVKGHSCNLLSHTSSEFSCLSCSCIPACQQLSGAGLREALLG